LNKECESKSSRLAELKAQYEEGVRTLQIKRDTFMDSRWRDVGQIQVRIRDFLWLMSTRFAHLIHLKSLPLVD
jgi:hypothetical protein